MVMNQSNDAGRERRILRRIVTRTFKGTFDIIIEKIISTNAAKIIAQGIDKLSGVMSSGKVGRNRDNSKYACPSCKDSFNASDTTEHNNLLKRESGPFKKE